MLRGALSRPNVQIIKDQEVETACWIPAPDAAGPQLLRCSLRPHDLAHGHRRDIIADAQSGQVIVIRHPILTPNTLACMHSDGELLVVEKPDELKASPHSMRWYRYDWRKGVVMHQWQANDWCSQDLQGMLSPGDRPRILSILQPDLQVTPRLTVTDVDTLQEEPSTVTRPSCEGSPSSLLALVEIEEASLSPDGTMAAVLIRGETIGGATIRIMHVTTGTCLASRQILCETADMRWSPTLPLLALRGYADIQGYADIRAYDERRPGHWILDARNGESMHVKPNNGYAGHAWWAPCGELLVLVTSDASSHPESPQLRDWVAATVYEVANHWPLNGTAIWSAKWACIDEGQIEAARDVSCKPMHPLSAWANPASWAGSPPNHSPAGLPKPVTTALAFFHGARSLLRFQKDERGTWTVAVQTIDAFASHVQPLLDPAGRVLIGAAKANGQLMHEDLKSGLRHNIGHATGGIQYEMVHQLNWAPLPVGWRPLYACTLLDTYPWPLPDQLHWSIAIVDAYAHTILHCWRLSDLGPGLPLGLPEAKQLALSSHDPHKMPDLQWSSNSRHLAVIGRHASAIVSFRADRAGMQNGASP